MEELYAGRQCSNCDIRFKLNETSQYNKHLDWHFQQNRRKKIKRGRDWYPKHPAWTRKEEESESSEDKEPCYFEKQRILRDKKPPVPPSCPAGEDSVNMKCNICHEIFDQFFDDDSEQWHLRNAVRVHNIPVHPTCSKDLKKLLQIIEVKEIFNSVCNVIANI